MDIQELKSKKRRLLLKGKENERALEVIFEPKRISPCGKYIEFGGHFGDEIRGWYLINDVAEDVVSVLEVFD